MYSSVARPRPRRIHLAALVAGVGFLLATIAWVAPRPAAAHHGGQAVVNENPVAGFPGSTIRLTGSGFRPSAAISVQRLGSGSQFATLSANGAGRLNANLTVPDDGPGAVIAILCDCAGADASLHHGPGTEIFVLDPVVLGPTAADAGQTVTFTADPGRPGNFNDLFDFVTPSWRIERVGGGVVTTGGGTSVSFSTPVAGSYRAVLTYTNASGATMSDVHPFTVAPGTSDPVAVVSGPISGTVGTSLTFTALGSFDPDGGDIASVSWSFGDGSSGSGVSASHAWSSPGTYTVRATVVDDEGATDSATSTVTIAALPNQGPTAAITGPSSGLVGEPLSFSGAGSSDPDGSIVGHTWTFGDGAGGSGRRVTHAWSSPGRYDIVLRVTDDAGAADTVVRRVTIRPRPVVTVPATTVAPGPGVTTPGTTDLPDIETTSTTLAPGETDDTDGDDGDGGPVLFGPIADPGGPYEVKVGEPVSFDGTGSVAPAGSEIESYTWSSGDGVSLEGSEVRHTYTRAGTFRLTLEVVDDEGRTSTALTEVEVIPVDTGDGLPVVQINGPYQGFVGEAINFSAAGTTDDGEIVSYSWIFAFGGEIYTEAEFARVFDAPGEIPALLTVTDDEGNVVQAATTVTILPAGCAVLSSTDVEDFRARPRLATTSSAFTTFRLVANRDCGGGIPVLFKVDGVFVGDPVLMGAGGVAEAGFRMPEDLEVGEHLVEAVRIDADGEEIVLGSTTWELRLEAASSCPASEARLAESESASVTGGVRVAGVFADDGCVPESVDVEVAGLTASFDVERRGFDGSVLGDVPVGEHGVFFLVDDEIIGSSAVTIETGGSDGGSMSMILLGGAAGLILLTGLVLVPRYLRVAIGDEDEETPPALA